MRIERIEIRVTDLKTRLQRQRSTGPYDTGAPGALLGKPVLVKIYRRGQSSATARSGRSRRIIRCRTPTRR